MSLKGFHIIFIISSILLLIGFAYWSFSQYSQNHQMNYMLTAAVSLLIAGVLAVYEINFIKKVKE